MLKLRFLFVLLFSLLLSFAYAGVDNVFQMKDYHMTHLALRQSLIQAINTKNYEVMEDICAKGTETFPNDPYWHYNLACAKTRRGKLDEARKALMKAAELGFSDLKTLLSDNDLVILRRDPAFTAAKNKVKYNAENPDKLPGAARAIKVYEDIVISSETTTWDFNGGFFRVLFEPYDITAITRRETNIPGKTGRLLKQWLEEGTASGNYGDIYDNHDKGHSVLDTSLFPGLESTTYSEEAKSCGADTAYSLFSFRGRPVFGNSSTANLDPIYWGSCARKVQNTAIGLLLNQYLSNTIYVYPQHNDYLKDKEGDVFPVRTPYIFISPWSSWTDRPILASLATASAALRPEVKSHLVKSGMLAPTMQYLLRSSQEELSTRTDYLTPRAHPVIFDGNKIDTLKLIDAAHALTISNLPPIAMLGELSFSASPNPEDTVYMTQPERYFDTPFSISRVWRLPYYTRTIELSAADPNKTAKEFHWFVGQGDEKKIRITKLEADGSRVKIEIDYHAPSFDTPFDIKSSRVDIICVADSGTHYSAPSFYTYYFPPNEKRTYNEKKLPITIEYQPLTTEPTEGEEQVYADLDVVRNRTTHRMDFKYDKDGKPIK